MKLQRRNFLEVLNLCEKFRNALPYEQRFKTKPPVHLLKEDGKVYLVVGNNSSDFCKVPVDIVGDWDLPSSNYVITIQDWREACRLTLDATIEVKEVNYIGNEATLELLSGKNSVVRTLGKVMELTPELYSTPSVKKGCAKLEGDSEVLIKCMEYVSFLAGKHRSHGALMIERAKEGTIIAATDVHRLLLVNAGKYVSLKGKLPGDKELMTFPKKFISVIKVLRMKCKLPTIELAIEEIETKNSRQNTNIVFRKKVTGGEIYASIRSSATDLTTMSKYAAKKNTPSFQIYRERFLPEVESICSVAEGGGKIAAMEIRVKTDKYILGYVNSITGGKIRIEGFPNNPQFQTTAFRNFALNAHFLLDMLKRVKTRNTLVKIAVSDGLSPISIIANVPVAKSTPLKVIGIIMPVRYNPADFGW